MARWVGQEAYSGVLWGSSLKQGLLCLDVLLHHQLKLLQQRGPGAAYQNARSTNTPPLQAFMGAASAAALQGLLLVAALLASIAPCVSASRDLQELELPPNLVSLTSREGQERLLTSKYK